LKKHLLSIITTALVVVNLIMSVVIVFTVLPTTSKINNLVTQICAALALDLESAGDGANTLKIEDLEEIPVGEEMTINLKSGNDNKDHYVLVQVAVIVNNKHEDYKKYVKSLTEKSSLIKDTVISNFSEFTYEDLQDEAGQEEVKEAILAELQKLFNSRFIVKVAFTSITFQ